MMFLEDIQRLTELPPGELEWFMAISEERHLNKRDVFCRIGQRRHELAIVEAGVLQIHGVTSQGENVVLDFVFPGEAALALDAAIRGAPSDVQIEAIDPVTLRVWPYDMRSEAFERHVGWQKFETLLTERAFVRKHKRYLSLRTRTARERFDDLDQDLPARWRQLPLNLLASYLSITPQYLSALRRRLGTGPQSTLS